MTTLNNTSDLEATKNTLWNLQASANEIIAIADALESKLKEVNHRLNTTERLLSSYIAGHSKSRQIIPDGTDTNTVILRDAVDTLARHYILEEID